MIHIVFFLHLFLYIKKQKKQKKNVIIIKLILVRWVHCMYTLNDWWISVSHFVNNRLKQCFLLTLHESFCNRNSRHVYLKHKKKTTQRDLNLNSGSLESITFLYLLCFGCFKCFIDGKKYYRKFDPKRLLANNLKIFYTHDSDTSMILC